MKFFLSNNEVLRLGEVLASRVENVEQALTPNQHYKLLFDVIAPQGGEADTISFTLRWEGAPDNFVLDEQVETAFNDFTLTANNIGDNSRYYAFEPTNNAVFNLATFTLMALFLVVEKVDDVWVIKLRLVAIDENGEPV